MGCGDATGFVNKTLSTSDGAAAYEPFTDWIGCQGIDAVRAVWKQHGMAGTLDTKFAVQYAPIRTDDPGTWIASGTTLSGAGEQTQTVDLTSLGTTPDDQLYVRFGLELKSTTVGGGMASADVEFLAAYNNCGRVVGRLAPTQLEAHSTTALYHPIGPWIPIEAVDSVKAAFVMSSPISTTLEFDLAYRTAATSVQDPASWTSQGTWYDAVSDAEKNTSWWTPTFPTSPDHYWVQFGIAYKLSSAGADQATAQATVLVKSP